MQRLTLVAVALAMVPAAALLASKLRRKKIAGMRPSSSSIDVTLAFGPPPSASETLSALGKSCENLNVDFPDGYLRSYIYIFMQKSGPGTHKWSLALQSLF